MAWGPRHDTDLEPIPTEGAAVEEAIPRCRRPDRHPVAAVGAVGLVMIVAVTLATAVALHRYRTTPTRSGAPRAAEINGRASVRLSHLVTVVGDKLLSRAITDISTVGPLGLIRLAPAGPGDAATLGVNSRSIVAVGTDLSGVEKTGAWAYPIPGHTAPVFLGPSTEFVLSLDSRAAWLATRSTVREVDVSTGSTSAGPYSIDGRLVDAAGAGLVLQRGEQVVWWLPGTPSTSEVIGSGQALAATGDYILWQTSSGLVTITDPNTRRTARVAFSLSPGQHVTASAMTSDLFRVATATGTALVISDTFKHRRINVQIGPVSDMAWLDDNTLLVRVGARAVVVVDAASGVVAHEPDLPFDAQGLGVIQTPS